MSSFTVSTQEQESTAESDFSGQVTKWPVGNSLMGSAKKRFMVLKAGSIAYYDNESSYLGGSAPLNSYHLNPSSVIKRTEDAIKVEITRGKEAILFKSKGETQRWEDCLLNTIEMLVKNSLKGEYDDEDVEIDINNLGIESALVEHQDHDNSNIKLLGGNIIKKPKSGGFGGAKKRYLILNPDNGLLLYYESIQSFDKGNDPKGTFQINSDTNILKMQDDHKNIDIRLESKKESFEFRAIGQENQWLRAISSCIERISSSSLVKGIESEQQIRVGSIDTRINSDDNENTGISTLNNVASGYIIKWPTSNKVGGVKSRYLEIVGDVISYYITKDGPLKGSFIIDANSTIKIEDNKIMLNYDEAESFVFQSSNTKSPNFRHTLEAWYGIILEKISKAKLLNISVITTKDNAVTYHALNAMASKLDFEADKLMRFEVIVVTDPEYNTDSDQKKGEEGILTTELGPYFNNIDTVTELVCRRIESYSTISSISELETSSLSTRLLQSEALMVFCNPKASEENKSSYIRRIEAASREANVEGGLTIFSIDQQQISSSSAGLDLCVPVYQDDTWGEYGDFPSAAFGIPVIVQADKVTSEFYETGFENKILFQALANLGSTAKDSFLQMNIKAKVADLLLHCIKDLHVHVRDLFPKGSAEQKELTPSKNEKVDDQVENNTNSSTNAY